jgi:hypothetical protein
MSVSLIVIPLLDARFLQAGDTYAVVLNQSAGALFPEAKMGEEIQLLIEGQPSSCSLVGVIRQSLSPSAA